MVINNNINKLAEELEKQELEVRSLIIAIEVMS